MSKDYTEDIAVGVTIQDTYGCKTQYVESEWRFWCDKNAYTFADVFEAGYGEYDETEGGYVCYTHTTEGLKCSLYLYAMPRNEIYVDNTKVTIEIPCPYPIYVELFLTQDQLKTATMFEME